MMGGRKGGGGGGKEGKGGGGAIWGDLSMFCVAFVGILFRERLFLIRGCLLLEDVIGTVEVFQFGVLKVGVELEDVRRW